MKNSTIAFILAILSLGLKAQTIEGSVKDELDKPISSVTISLLTASDSLIKIELTKSDGNFLFKNIPLGKYKITATHIGYETFQSDDFELDSNIIVSNITLKKESKDLASVVIIAKKPLIQVKADRTIVNVEGSINAAGNTVLELLRKSPGVTLDKDDNISLSGKNGVRIYIDGRPTALSGQDLNAYLQSIQSSNVEAIELITNPSAKFEAAGNAGIINIRLKKNTAVGTNGTINAGFNMGKFAKYNSGFSFNYRNTKTNLFGSYNYSGGLNDYEIKIYRSILDSIFDQKGRMQENNLNHQFKTGIDYFIKKNHTIGLLINGNFSSPTITNNSRVAISHLGTRITDRILLADNTLEQKRNSAAFNLNYNFTNASGKYFSFNADHAFYNLRGDQMQPNDYYDATGTNRISRVVYQMISPTAIQINSFNGDYEQNIKNGRLSVGSKVASINTDNDFHRYNVYDNSKDLDKDRSNRFRYRETIASGYLQYSKEGKGFIAQGGIRLENTKSVGRSTGLRIDGTGYSAYDSSFQRNYTDIFPSIAVTLNKNVMKQWTISYSRRIDRPAYQELNPFEFKVDEYTSQKGSIDLRPQYTNSFGISYVHNHKITGSINYSRIKDLFVQLMDTVEKSKAFITSKNFGAQDVVSLSLTYPFQYKSYSLMANATSHYKQLNAKFGASRDIDIDVTGIALFAQNSIKFKKEWTAELTGFYNSPTIYGSNLKARAMWSIDAGMQKRLFNNNANIKLSVSDVFNSLRFEGSSFFAGQQATFTRKAESRQVKLSFNWRFGSNTIKAARQHKAGAEEEMKRVQ